MLHIGSCCSVHNIHNNTKVGSMLHVVCMIEKSECIARERAKARFKVLVPAKLVTGKNVLIAAALLALNLAAARKSLHSR